MTLQNADRKLETIKLLKVSEVKEVYGVRLAPCGNQKEQFDNTLTGKLLRSNLEQLRIETG